MKKWAKSLTVLGLFFLSVGSFAESAHTEENVVYWKQHWARKFGIADNDINSLTTRLTHYSAETLPERKIKNSWLKSHARAEHWIADLLSDMVEIPAVTQEDVAFVASHGPDMAAGISQPQPAFKTPAILISTGLFLAVTGHYPDISKFSEKRQKIFRSDWEEFPERGMNALTVEDQREFTKKLSAITGRNFVPSQDQQNAAMIPGRDLKNNIVITNYFYGDDFEEIENHAWIGYKSHALGVREVPPGKDIRDFTNSYGLIHPIGNLYIKSDEGTLRGGSFGSSLWVAESAERFEGYAEDRSDAQGFRVVEYKTP